MIAVGDRIPDVELKAVTTDGTEDVNTGALLGTGRVVLFGVPGAFTPVCSDFHLPGFVLKTDDLKAKGVEQIFCVSVNDAFVMGAWGRSEDAVGITMLADADAAFTTAMGLAVDASSFGLGTRSERYAAVLEDGVVVSLEVEKTFVDHEVSTAEHVLASL
ncbi:peroxiredoxin [Actinomycetospora corticicola]|uniref:Glutathione-dependent peroxiredoxin n=1 Tax=Actinomycetospora corticicola TaxID=663602 RepID=A0A7Y9DX49_9PSEU|nr:peroxiredoxin [Actinomycetospora corticicola]NYD37050.1 peroxiredoxin [Actinomycetospora corticicola]